MPFHDILKPQKRQTPAPPHAGAGVCCPRAPAGKSPKASREGPAGEPGRRPPKQPAAVFPLSSLSAPRSGTAPRPFSARPIIPPPGLCWCRFSAFFRPSCGGSRLAPFQGSRRAGTKEGRAAQKKSGSDLIAPLFCYSRETGKSCPCLFPAAAAAGTEARNKRFPSAAPGGFPFYCARGGHPASPRRGKYFRIRPKTKRKPAACAAGFLQGVWFWVRRNHVQKSGCGFRLSVILIIGAS